MANRGELLGALQIPLVGRKDYLGKLEEYVKAEQERVLYGLVGEGGVGKTALLEEFLKRIPQWGPDALVPTAPVDLYHTDAHTEVGLMQQLVKRWRGQETNFPKFIQAMEAMEKALREGREEEVEQQREAMREGLIQDLNILAAKQLVVIALDTAEVLEYVVDDFQRSEKFALEIADIGQWLLERFLPQLTGRFLLLMAGRPVPPERAWERRFKALGDKGWQIDLQPIKPLSLEETQDYLEGVAKSIEARGSRAEGKRIQEFARRYGQELYRLTGGHPIYLAMVADILVSGGDLPPGFMDKEPIPREEVEGTLARHIQEIRSPLGETLRTLGWLSKGLDAELLAILTDGLHKRQSRSEVPPGEIFRARIPTKGGEAEAKQLLHQIEGLAIVKRRPFGLAGKGIRPYFFHDEIYTILRRRGLVLADRGETEEILTPVIEDYYQYRRRILRERMAERGLEIPTLQARWQAETAEELHYRLLRDPWDGFDWYFQWAEEALTGRDKVWDMLLRSELLRTIHLREREGYCWPEEWMQWVRSDIAIRWGMRPLFFRNNFQEALQTFANVRKWLRQEGLWEHVPLAQHHLLLYEAVAMLRLGRYDEAQRYLEKVRDWVAKHSGKRREAQRALRVMKAMVENYLGYLARLQGRYEAAIEHYQAAAVAGRNLRLETTLGVLVNQAYVTALMGDFASAKTAIEEARWIVQRVNRSFDLGRVWNVRALVEIYQYHTDIALDYANRALEQMEEAEHTWGIGVVSTTRARAQRYKWVSYAREERWEMWKETLVPAREDVDRAIEMLKSGTYWVEALIEGGCVYRELARVYRRFDEREKEHWLQRYPWLDHATQKTEEYLLKAAGIPLDAEEWVVPEQWSKELGGPYYPALALVNLAWHAFYQRDDEKMNRALEAAERTIREWKPDGERYFLGEGQPRPSIERDQAYLHLWNVMGKGEMARAYRALREYRRSGESSKLEEMVWHATLSLEYDRQIAEDYFEIRLAQEGLHMMLIRLWRDFPDLVPALYRHAKEAQDRIGLTEETLLLRFLRARFGEERIWEER